MTVAHNEVYSSGLYLFFQPEYMYGLACLFEMYLQHAAESSGLVKWVTARHLLFDSFSGQ